MILRLRRGARRGPGDPVDAHRRAPVAAFRMVKTFSPLGEVGGRLTFNRDVREMHRLELENVPLYFVALLRG